VKYLLDTNVYIEAVRSESRQARFRAAFFPLLPATFLSAVVAYELRASAADGRTAVLVRDFTRPMERTGRVVTPTFDDWATAAEVVTDIQQRDRSWRSKLPALLNDILIVLCARRIGAMLITHNREDFRLIRRHVSFSLRILEPAGGVG
jgi:predicted nucleic acid-binding protein